MDYISLLKNVMGNIRVTAPVILIGDAVVMFKKMYSGPIREVYTSDDVRDVVSDYYGIDNLTHPLIIEDLAMLSSSSSFLILKLVEEAKFPIILLSSYDKVSPILLSRCKTIVKFSLTTINSQFMSAYRGREAMDDYLGDGSARIDQLRWMRDNSPVLYYYENKVANKSKSSVEKMLGLIM